MGSTLTPAGYLPRVADGELRAALAASPAVLVEGPRACGKTWTARHFAAGEQPLDADVSARLAANADPGPLLEGPTPRLLDEWQLAPGIWNPMRRACDDRGLAGQFILTGSANPPDDITRHSGAGRVLRVRMRPMSLFESGDSGGAVSLSGLFEGGQCSAGDSGHRLDDIMGLACRGGWPRLVATGADADTSLRVLRGYLDEIARTDVARVDGVSRDPRGVRRLLESLARNTATEAGLTTLAADTAEGGVEMVALHRRTVASYLTALGRLFVLEELPAFRPHLASRARLRSAPKRHLACPSLAVAALGATAETLMGDLRFAGRIFESLVLRDLRVLGQSAGCELAHYRDSDGLEVDGILRRPDGAWIAVEVKLGGEAAIDAAAVGLLRLAQKVDTDRAGAPSRLVVVTASGYGYQRPDNVAVVPITALGP